MQGQAADTTPQSPPLAAGCPLAGAPRRGGKNSHKASSVQNTVHPWAPSPRRPPARPPQEPSVGSHRLPSSPRFPGTEERAAAQTPADSPRAVVGFAAALHGTAASGKPSWLSAFSRVVSRADLRLRTSGICLKNAGSEGSVPMDCAQEPLAHGVPCSGGLLAALCLQHVFSSSPTPQPLKQSMIYIYSSDSEKRGRFLRINSVHPFSPPLPYHVLALAKRWI